MANEIFADVWDALEQDPVERARLKLLSDLMIEMQEHIKAQGWTQAEAATHLGVTQPRISDLMRGKITLFSIDAVIAMLTQAGRRVSLTVDAAA